MVCQSRKGLYRRVLRFVRPENCPVLNSGVHPREMGVVGTGVSAPVVAAVTGRTSFSSLAAHTAFLPGGNGQRSRRDTGHRAEICRRSP